MTVPFEDGLKFFAVDDLLGIPGPAAVLGGKHGRGPIMDVVTDSPAFPGIGKPDCPQPDFHPVHLFAPGPAAVAGVQKNGVIILFQSWHFAAVARDPTMFLIHKMK